jgi:hypothetical protein
MQAMPLIPEMDLLPCASASLELVLLQHITLRETSRFFWRTWVAVTIVLRGKLGSTKYTTQILM